MSHDLAYTGLWEPHVLYDFQDVLLRDSSLGVIDIGANIGVYTLLPAAMGHQVCVCVCVVVCVRVRAYVYVCN